MTEGDLGLAIRSVKREGTKGVLPGIEATKNVTETEIVDIAMCVIHTTGQIEIGGIEIGVGAGIGERRIEIAHDPQLRMELAQGHAHRPKVPEQTERNTTMMTDIKAGGMSATETPCKLIRQMASMPLPTMRMKILY